MNPIDLTVQDVPAAVRRVVETLEAISPTAHREAETAKAHRG